ncbi:MAG TPA: nitronate monooxygenase [Streptosporangiaceae bacterium]|jgi:NAD(P)H-dependent flavin oxidoreductase YrpB (nitropropane dioxygenase family)
MRAPLSDLGLAHPVLAAPMAGGGTTPALVVAAARSGSFGFLAAGYKTPAALADQIHEVSQQTPTFGVNLFAPNPVPADPAEFRRYAAALQPEADRYGIDLRGAAPVADDDGWADKVGLLLERPVPLVSFTFGLPDPATIAALRRAGTITVQTVTSAAEAKAAQDAGVDVLAVQASAAGGHSATLTPERLPADVPLPELVARVRAVTDLPVIAAGGVGTPADVAAALGAGADAVMVGTVLLRSEESGASAVHQAALADPGRGPTILTRSFTGRPARALPNRFTSAYHAIAPAGYPAIHHLTSTLRKTAAAAGDPELVHLWAGTAHRQATPAPAATTLTHLAEGAGA